MSREHIRDHAVTTEAALREDIREALYDFGLGYLGTEETENRIALSAGEYAAAQVEAHARPGPWPPRHPERRGGHAARREAG